MVKNEKVEKGNIFLYKKRNINPQCMQLKVPVIQELIL